MIHKYLSPKKYSISLEVLVIIAVIILAFFIRIYNLTDVPYGFHADEASIGYNAYTILTKGTDEYGTPFPVFFKSFGEYKSPVQIYSTVPLVALFGLNEFSTRLTSVIYALLSIIVAYFLTIELFKSEKQSTLMGLFTIFFLAISPWHIQFSRVAYELIPFLFYTELGLLIFLKAQSRPWLLPFSIFTFSLALYSYYAGRIFIPLFSLCLVCIYRNFLIKNKKQTLISFILLLFLLIPFIENLFSHEALVRWDQTSIFIHQPKNTSIQNQIEINYFNHFSPVFLFTEGNNALAGNKILRDAPNGMGEMYLFQLPLILFGIYQLVRRKDKTFYIILFWLLLYPISGIFADDGSPFARRSVIGVIPFQILSAVGGVFLFNMIGKWKNIYTVLFSSIAGIIIVFSFAFYMHLYFFDYPKYSSSWWGWQYGPKDIVAYFASHETQYDDLIMSPYFNGRFEFFKFYAPNDCKKCKVGLPEDFYSQYRKQIYALPPSYLNTHAQFIYIPRKLLYYPDGSVAYILAELKNKSH